MALSSVSVVLSSLALNFYNRKEVGSLRIPRVNRNSCRQNFNMFWHQVRVVVVVVLVRNAAATGWCSPTPAHSLFVCVLVRVCLPFNTPTDLLLECQADRCQGRTADVVVGVGVVVVAGSKATPRW